MAIIHNENIYYKEDPLEYGRLNYMNDAKYNYQLPSIVLCLSYFLPYLKCITKVLYITFTTTLDKT